MRVGVTHDEVSNGDKLTAQARTLQHRRRDRKGNLAGPATARRRGRHARPRLALDAALRVSPRRLPRRPALGHADENEPARGLGPSAARPSAVPFATPPRNEAPAADTYTTDPRANENLGTEVRRPPGADGPPGAGGGRP